MKIFLIFILTICALIARAQSEDNIILINVENLDRAGIAEEISTLSKFNPKVIAIDLQFSKRNHDAGDEELIKALWACKNLVMTSVINDLAGNVAFSLTSQLEFSPHGVKTGYINALQENDVHGTIKSFLVQEKEDVADKRIEYHFAVSTAMAYDSLQTAKFINTHPTVVDVDYKNGQRKFRKYSAKEVLSGKLNERDLTGKIVMIGFLGPGNEDKFYSPLNKTKKPDIYGLEYLANVVAQILDQK